MSLTDTDKINLDRGAPTPNHSDVIIDGASKAHNTLSTHYKTDADTNTQRLQMQNKQIVGSNGVSQIVNYGVQTDGNFALKFFDTNGIGVARFGQFSDGSIALKVAKSGQEVDSATNSQLVFNSTQDTFKIVSKNSAAFSFTSGGAGPGSTTVTINHNLGYVPIIQPEVTITTLTNGSPGIYPLPFFVPGLGGGTTNVFILLSYLRVSGINSTSVTFEVGIQAPSQTFAGTITCYFLQETAV